MDLVLDFEGRAGLGGGRQARPAERKAEGDREAWGRSQFVERETVGQLGGGRTGSV